MPATAAAKAGLTRGSKTARAPRDWFTAARAARGTSQLAFLAFGFDDGGGERVVAGSVGDIRAARDLATNRHDARGALEDLTYSEIRCSSQIRKTLRRDGGGVTGVYHEIQAERRRYRIVDPAALAAALEIDVERLAAPHRE